MDFVEEGARYSVIKEATTIKNLIVVRSLTKFYGFPGLRLGYLIACESTINLLLRYKEPWTVNALAQVAGQVAINDKEFVLRTRSFMFLEKTFLYESLSRIRGLYSFHPSANFILVKIGVDGKTSSIIHDLLIKNNIVIRDCSNFVGLSDKYFRVAVRTREENQRLLSTLKLVMEDAISERTNQKCFVQEFVTG